MQSVPTHNEYLETITIKKGTIIIIDVNTKDYQGRASVPDHFVPDNRILVKPLINGNY